MTLRNVPSFLLARDREIGGVPYDMAYGGNFYALVEASAAGMAVDPARSDELIARGLEIMAAINAADAPVHPEDARIAGCRHVVFYEDGPGRRAQRDRDPARLAGPLAVRHGHDRRGWPRCTRAASWRSARRSSTSP